MTTKPLCGDEVEGDDYGLTCDLPKGHKGLHRGVAFWD
jgi:hypothetical protein